MEHTLFQIGGFGVTSQMTTMLAITLLLVTVSYFGTRRMEKRPRGLQNALEKIVEMLYDFLSEQLGPELARTYLPFLGTMFLFIVLSNYSGLLPLAGRLPGLAPPTGCLSVTAGLALCTFGLTHFGGGRSHGLHYVEHFTKPAIFMLPLMLIEEIVRPVSLSLRLFGNIYGEETVTHEIFHMIPLLAPIVMNVLSLLLGFVQGMVFVMLSCIYLSGAAGEGH